MVSASKDQDDDTNDDKDDNFIWQDYLEMTKTEEVPHVLFTHVEKSLLSGVLTGMVLEVPDKHDPTCYWLASVSMACGPLLRLRYLGQGDTQDRGFWCDLNKMSVHPLGWSEPRGLRMAAPSELGTGGANLREMVRKEVEGAKTVPAELLSGDGLIPVDRIKQGMKLEVQDKKNPYHLWVATVIENVGGRLLLRYDTPDSSSTDFWLFYSSPRLFRMGWTESQGSPWKLQWPSNINTQRSSEEWHAILEMAKQDARRLPMPPDLLQDSLNSSVPHNFRVGMKVEAVNPQNMEEICPASVVRVFDSNYFLVRIDNHMNLDTNKDLIWLCTVNTPYILPVGWAKKRNIHLTHPKGWTCASEEFDWLQYLGETGSSPAPANIFPHSKNCSDLGIKPDMKLEAVNPENPNQICVASIVKIESHLLWIHIEPDNSKKDFIVSIDSSDIFPVGWCESNSYPLNHPQSCKRPSKPKAEDTNINIRKDTSVRSSWCPKIYFNHKCFSGPFLSKGKLAQLPKAVGPGPVTLVLKEVLSMLISVAYKSSRVLKELQCDSKHPPTGMMLEVLKAKYKNNTYRASVAVVTSADEVPSFCKKVCDRLQVCPYMFGPVAITEDCCPEKCSNLSKTRFTQYWVQSKRKIGRPKGAVSNLVPRQKKKRGRKKLVPPERPLTELSLLAKDSNTSSPSAAQETETSSARQLRTQLKKDVPSSPIKTRATKSADSDVTSKSSPLKRRSNEQPHKSPPVDKNDESDGSSSMEIISIPKELNKEKESPSKMNAKKQSKETSNEMSPSLKIETVDEVEIKSVSSLKIHSKSSDVKASRSIDTKSNSDVIKQESPVKSEPEDKTGVTVKPNTDDDEDNESHNVKRMKTVDVMELESNPLNWTEDDVYKFLSGSKEYAGYAKKFKEELIDGQAFMMLNLPTLLDHLYMQQAQALKVCQLIEKVKLAYYVHYIVNKTKTE